MNDHYEQEIDLKWLLYRVIRAWRSIVLVALIAALAVGGFKFLSAYRSASNPTKADAANAAYQAELTIWENKTEQLNAEIRNLTKSIDEQLIYNQNSVLMQINPLREYHASCDLYVDYDYQIMPELTYQNIDLSGPLLKAYQNYISNGELFTDILSALSFEIEQRYLTEIMTVSVDFENNNRMLSVNISHYDPACAKEILSLAKENLLKKQSELNSTIAEHNLIIANEADFETVNLDLSAKQKKNQDTVTTLNKTLQEKQTELKAVTKPSPVGTASVSQAAKSALKYFLLAGVVAAFLMAVLIAGICILSGKLLNPTDMKSRFRLHIIGQLPTARTKRPFAFVSRLIASVFGITTVPEDYQKLAKMVGSSIRSGLVSREADTNKASLAFTGTMNEDSIQSVIAATGLQDCACLICAPDLLGNADSVEKISSADYVILLVEQETTSLSDIEKMLEALKTWNKPVLGTVILNVDAVM